MSRGLILPLFLSGCATCDPVSVPQFVQVPEACLQVCEYRGPEKIVTNGDLLEGWRGRLEQVTCYESRIQCVKNAH